MSNGIKFLIIGTAMILMLAYIIVSMPSSHDVFLERQEAAREYQEFIDAEQCREYRQMIHDMLSRTE
jgi:hypothetical protein